jgi:crossover junction endodeoxyribonuclease RuvC
MTAVILGIDIGLSGALAIIDENGKLIGVPDMPCLADGPAGRRSINGPLLSQLVAESHAAMAFVEHVGVRPGEGPVGAFAFGKCRGLVEGVLAALSIPTQFITAPS